MSSHVGIKQHQRNLLESLYPTLGFQLLPSFYSRHQGCPSPSQQCFFCSGYLCLHNTWTRLNSPVKFKLSSRLVCIVLKRTVQFHYCPCHLPADPADSMRVKKIGKYHDIQYPDSIQCNTECRFSHPGPGVEPLSDQSHGVSSGCVGKPQGGKHENWLVVRGGHKDNRLALDIHSPRTSFNRLCLGR
jgi:hypothetical protein